MRDQDKDKQLNGNAPEETYSLDDILAEFGSGHARPRAVPAEPELPGPDLPWPEAPRRPRPEGKLVVFPGASQEEDEPESDEPEEPFSEEDGEDATENLPEETELSASEDDKVIAFPEEESVLSAFLKDIGKKADDYADQMFQEDEAVDREEVRRLERLIPGTDREEEPQPQPARLRLPRRKEAPPPDAPPQKLAQRYSKGLRGMAVRCWLLVLLFLLALVQALSPVVGPVIGWEWIPALAAPAVQAWICVGLLGLGTLLAMDAVLVGLIRAFQLKFGMDTLAALACLFTLADGVQLALSPQPEERLPYALACLAGLYFQLRGRYHKQLAARLSCRTAAAAAHPYRVTLDEGKWSGRDTYMKWQGDAQGFGSQIQADDGAQRIFRRVCPLLFLADVTFSLLTSLGTGNPHRLLWALSALFTVTAAFGGGIAYGRSFHKAARRLVQSGAALAGWPGIARAGRGDRVVLTDSDLFPPGHVELNGYKVLGDFPAERVVAYTTTLILNSGSSLGRVFHDHLRSMGGLLRRADQLTCYEGGLSANIRGDQVLVGSASFMSLMEISLPQGLNVKNAVFCAIDGRLAGIFALNYTLPDTVFPAVEELLLEKVGPVLATRDFNLIPAMLQQRFKLAADKMDFPPVERRRELSDPDQPHGDTLTALLCREGLLPLAESIAAARRLGTATRLGAVICCAGSLLGLVLAAYLTSIGAYTSLSTLSLLIYLLTWLAPVWLLSGWAHRF